MTTTRATAITVGNAEVWKDENDIYRISFLPGTYITEQDLRDQIAYIAKDLNGSGKALVLAEGPAIKGVSPKARNYLCSPEAAETYLALAGLTPNIMTRVIGSFFLGINKPKFHFSLFSKAPEAIEWLLSFK